MTGIPIGKEYLFISNSYFLCCNSETVIQVKWINQEELMVSGYSQSKKYCNYKKNKKTKILTTINCL